MKEIGAVPISFGRKILNGFYLVFPSNPLDH